MKLACGLQELSGSHSVYLDVKLDGVNRSFLLDSGCDMTLIPSHFVKGRRIRRTRKTVHAANGAEIILSGEVSLKLHIGNLAVDTEALVSDFVSEGMLGYDWLSQNDCYWGFRAGQVMIQDQVFALRQRDSTLSCCRITVQENVVIPSRSETVISGKAVFNKIGRASCRERV